MSYFSLQSYQQCAADKFSGNVFLPVHFQGPEVFFGTGRGSNICHDGNIGFELFGISVHIGAFELEYLRFIVFIIVIAAFVQLVEMILETFHAQSVLYPGIFLPLITVNCAILGVALFIVIRNTIFFSPLPMGRAEALAGPWLFWPWPESGKRWMRPKYQRVCRQALQMIVTGIMALAFIGFSGILAIQ